ncbi:uncharacterized protein LOC142178022 [Nicotiana tabacum]|uniref:Uncharacterized protein LOC142178022 n=1 Tax=Nicotiana tabacum TaxID=4097 RepID=A0AC58U1U2_TOBAC
MPTQPVVSVQPVVKEATHEEQHLRLVRFKKYHPPTFSSLDSEYAYGILGECYRILHAMGIVETSGVAFTTVQLNEAAYQLWQAYELGSPSDATSLSLVQVLEVFLREFVPQTPQYAWHEEFEPLREGTMSVSEYDIIFNELSRHTPTLVSIVRERVRRFIEGLRHDIQFSMAQELESDVPFQ